NAGTAALCSYRQWSLKSAISKAWRVSRKAGAIQSVIGAFAFIIWLTSFMRKKFFPISTFSLGQGSERNKHSEQMRWVVIVGFVISIVSSTLTTLIIAP
ncbi:hypothetical protein, partial [Pseudomonas kuykendallii]|uniref:hypothetical protein n=1 Tax=Pseudomonas kuykendallii TaxID=1007099 RepID=UPI002355AD8A